MRADQLLHEVYEFARSESTRKDRGETYREGVKRCMKQLQRFNGIVRSSTEVCAELVNILVRDMRRHVDATYSEALDSVENKMRESYEFWKDRPDSFSTDRSRSRRPMYPRKEG